ncbi:MAG: acetyl-CoA carboxylase, biotin carboxyl carrier protein [Thermomicrobiales bacterium]|nr:acetyl-CoA carboxylase, biotin carboxyl carrier protein [Thermomicrobiales bacterium]
MMREGGLTELDLAFGAVNIRLRGGASAAAPIVEATTSEIASVVVASEHTITAPMIGTFYTAPTPGAPSFIAVGDVVIPGQVVGIIEAMKIMNEITADRGGIVVELVAANGQAVEFGSPLVRLRPADASR